MKTAIAALSLVVLLAAVPAAAGADGTPPPLAVASASVGPVAVVAWAASTGVDVTYKVYGVDGGSLVFLDTTVATIAAVAGGFESYAVTAVSDAGESEPTYASANPCVRINPTDIPPVAIFLDCLDVQ